MQKYKAGIFMAAPTLITAEGALSPPLRLTQTKGRLSTGGLTGVESVADFSLYGVDSVTDCLSHRVGRSGRARLAFMACFICTSESRSG
jgi:hypothetical protein